MNSIIAIISLLIGYYLGNHSNAEEIVTDGVQRFKSKVTKMVTPTISTGQIKPRTEAEQTFRSKSKQEQEGLLAMKETLDASPELAEHRRLVQELKEKGEL